MSDETTKGPTFSAYILFSEAVQFNSSEIEAALLEDYPSLDITPEEVNGLPELHRDCDTAEFITAPILLGATGADARFVTLTRLPGYGTWDAAALPRRNQLHCPNIDDAMTRNKSYICVLCSAKDTSLQAAFRAARLCSCVAAIVAKLPVALATSWETADQFLSPAATIEMADTSLSDDWPVDKWMSVELRRGHDNGDPADWADGFSQGLAQFRGYELNLPFAPLALYQAFELMIAVATMSLAYGNEFNDGDTLGFEADHPESKYRLRRLPAGVQETKVDYLLVIHPQAKFDADEVLGPTASVPPSLGFDNSVRTKPDFFKRVLRGGRDS